MGAVMDELTLYVESMIGEPFVWGENDCLTFAQEAVKIQTGGYICDEWFGGYDTKREAAQQYNAMVDDCGFDNIIEAISSRFSQVLTLHPTHGMLVARPLVIGPLSCSFGVCVGRQLALMSLGGVVMVGPEVHDIYWDVR